MNAIWTRIVNSSLILSLLILSSCKIADISQSSQLSAQASEAKAMALLEESVSAQGFGVMQQKNVYEFTATDHWPGMMGNMVKLWPEQETKLRFRHNFNTFDGSGLFLSGERAGDLIGVQSWTFYEQKKGSDQLINADTGTEDNSLEFGMVVFHYFLELPYRLQNAPIKRYYGERSLRGQKYDLVFASWGSESPNPEHDQYILWINKSTKLVDYSVYTLRDNNNPITRQKYGSIAYLDYRDVEGFKVPFKMPVLIDDGVITAKSLDKYFHQFTLESFAFGGFEEAELYPLESIARMMDEKP